MGHDVVHQDNGGKQCCHFYNGENSVATFSRLFFIRSFLYLQVTRACSDEFEVRPDPTSDSGVSCP